MLFMLNWLRHLATDSTTPGASRWATRTNLSLRDTGQVAAVTVHRTGAVLR